MYTYFKNKHIRRETCSKMSFISQGGKIALQKVTNQIANTFLKAALEAVSLALIEAEASIRN